MNTLDLILLDFKECRRRFLIVAGAFPESLLTWRPDKNALSVGETIRHVLLHDFPGSKSLQTIGYLQKRKWDIYGQSLIAT